jgi:hypothetical protein
MKTCERCTGSGTIPEQTAQEILVDYMLNLGVEDAQAKAEAERVVNLFIRRGITMMRPSAIEELIYNAKFEAREEQAQAEPQEDHSELVAALRDMASRRRQALPDSPQAEALEKAADLLDGNS